MAKASGHKSKQEIGKINSDLNLIKNEVMDALTGVPFIENKCFTKAYVRDGKMFVEIVDARTLDIMRREQEKTVENKKAKGMATLYTKISG